MVQAWVAVADDASELGIMVWQDFMFGCGQACDRAVRSVTGELTICTRYPAYDEFLARVVPEVEANGRARANE